MIAFKGTPGPWFQSHRKSIYGGYRTEVYTADDEVVASVAWYPRKLNDTTTTTDRAANAQLIAAAPDLLEALQDALCALECCGKDFPAATKASAAIAKAIGEQP